MTRLEILRRGYLAPFQCAFRNLIYASGFLGCFGFSGAMMFFTFDLGAQGFFVLFSFFASRFISGNVIFMQLYLFLLHRFRGPKALFALIALGTIGSAASYSLLVLPQGSLLYALLSGFLFSMVSAGFWSLHHAAMTIYTSDQNIGNEIAICGIFDSIGSAMGFLAGGLVLAAGFSSGFALFFTTMLLASVCLALSLRGMKQTADVKPYNPIEKIKNGCPKRTGMTLFHGAVQFFSSFAAPVWLGMLGAKSAFAGFLMSLNIVLQFLVSPVIGHLFHQQKEQEVKIGAAFLTAGWLPLLIFQKALLYPLSSVLWMVGDNMLHVGTISRWYKSRDLADVAARELLLGAGRFGACALALPILFYGSPFLFFLLAGCVCGGAFLIFIRPAPEILPAE